MSETLQRTEQVITVTELREMLDDEVRRPNFQGRGAGSRRRLASRAGRPLALLAESKLVG